VPAELDPTLQAAKPVADPASQTAVIVRGRVFLATAMAIIVAFTLFNNWIEAPASDLQGILYRFAGTALLLVAFHRAYHGSGFFMGLLKLTLALVGLTVLFVVAAKYTGPLARRRISWPGDTAQLLYGLAIYSYLVWTFFLSRSVAAFWKSRRAADPFPRPPKGD
jgi:hypothetical protein